MATSSSTKQRSQGGGRTANSEPRIQVFKDFAGCNFQESPNSFTLGIEPDKAEQSDLQMNYVVVQNNASIANKTIETRNNIVKLFDAPDGTKLTETSLLVGNEFYIGTDDGNIRYGALGEDLANTIQLLDKNPKGHHWESLAYIDDKLVGTTAENQLWTGDIDKHEISNAKKVEKPDPLSIKNNLTPRGSLKLSDKMTEDCPHRTGIAYSYVNKFGPTECSEQITFYSNYPVSEWHSDCFLNIHGAAPFEFDIKAVELFFNVENSSSLGIAGRVDMDDGGPWSFNWVGYLDATNMWPMANTLSPTDNYTEGAPASRITCIDGRVYFWGDQEYPYRLYIGGNPGNLFSLSPGTSGGFVDVEPGTGQEVRYVDKYKTQSGNSIVTMLCDSMNSNKEQRFNLVENTITISNEQNMKSWQAEQVSGAVGCKSYHGAIVCEDGLYSVSRYGLALTTMTMEYNSQIRANYVSDPIKPVFTDPLGSGLSNAILLEVDGVLYMTFGDGSGDLDHLMFCYDIDAKAWWSFTLDIDEPIINLVHIDYEGFREGIGIITPDHVWLLPTTQDDDSSELATFDVLIETGELAAQQPQQSWIYLSQLEFCFDRFIGYLDIDMIGIDQFGRKITVHKRIEHEEAMFNFSEYMRVDLRMRSYKLIISGKANFRLSHFMAKVYTMSSKVGLVWGFDDRQSFRGDSGDIHPTFKCYNDIRKAIIP